MAGNPGWIDGWSKGDLDLLVQKREVEGKKWKVIAAEMNRPLKTCYDRYGKVLRLRPAPSIIPPSRPRSVPLHEELGIKTFVHRQAILSDPNGIWGSHSSNHWYRVNITLPKVFA